MTTGNGIPPDLWTRLAKLDHCCHVAIHSLYVPGGSGIPVRQWEITIRRKGDNAAPPVVVRSQRMIEGLVSALAEAARRGWPD